MTRASGEADEMEAHRLRKRRDALGRRLRRVGVELDDWRAAAESLGEQGRANGRALTRVRDLEDEARRTEREIAQVDAALARGAHA